MTDIEDQTVLEFLENEIYLPGYMALRAQDYDERGATFKFDVKEPPVARGDIVHYFTPRGLHICVSQAGYALAEYLVGNGLIEEIEISSLRETLLEGRVKITELYQKFRKEIGLGREIQGRFDISRLRKGKLPILKLDFAFENGAVSGNLVSMIVPRPTPPMNRGLLRMSI